MTPTLLTQSGTDVPPEETRRAEDANLHAGVARPSPATGLVRPALRDAGQVHRRRGESPAPTDADDAAPSRRRRRRCAAGARNGRRRAGDEAPGDGGRGRQQRRKHRVGRERGDIR